MEEGSRELVITGVNIGRYEDGGSDLVSLIDKILALPGDFRVRISSMEPVQLKPPFEEKFIELFSHPRLCPHLHICLQSGSEKMLLAMRRTYTVVQYREFVDKLRSRYPDMNLTTDIIVGFPGESEEDFKATCQITKEIGFSHVHTFKYSRRNGTRAARMGNQVPDPIKSARSETVRAIVAENKRQYRSGWIGRDQRVLIEKISDGHAKGYGQHYLPIILPAEGCELNSFRKVKIQGFEDGEDPVLLASLIT